MKKILLSVSALTLTILPIALSISCRATTPKKLEIKAKQATQEDVELAITKIKQRAQQEELLVALSKIFDNLNESNIDNVEITISKEKQVEIIILKAKKGYEFSDGETVLVSSVTPKKQDVLIQVELKENIEQTTIDEVASKISNIYTENSKNKSVIETQLIPELGKILNGLTQINVSQFRSSAGQEEGSSIIIFEANPGYEFKGGVKTLVAKGIK